MSPATLRRLKVESTSGNSSSGFCHWRQSGDGETRRTLEVSHRTYEPPKTRLEYSAAAEAGYRFRRLPGWEVVGPGTPVRGLGDEARIVRTFSTVRRAHTIRLAVRVRNVIVQLKSDQEARDVRDPVAPLSELEAGTADAAREMLARLGVRVPAPSAPPRPAAGEVSDVGGVCAKLDAAEALMDGIARSDAPGTALTGGCDWDGGDYRPELTVDVEALAPSPLTGETGTQIATTLLRRWRDDGSRAPDLGDEAKTDHFEFEKGRSRSSRILVRRGNVLVHVDYGRWNHPSKKALDDGAARVAEAVLKGLK